MLQFEFSFDESRTMMLQLKEGYICGGRESWLSAQALFGCAAFDRCQNKKEQREMISLIS